MTGFGLVVAGLLAGALVASVIWYGAYAGQAARVKALEGQVAELPALRESHQKAQVRLAELTKDLEVETSKTAWADQAQQKLEMAFAVLAAKALKENTAEAVGQTRTTVVDPLSQTLRELKEKISDLEQARVSAYSKLSEQLAQSQQAVLGLQATAVTLAQALKSSSVRGRWGELQLKRIVELAGMTEHVHFEEQAALEEGRPDMRIKLPDGGEIPVDSKAPMTAYLDASETEDVAIRDRKLQEHAQAMRQHVRALSDRQYWKQLPAAPEFVVMFIPMESCLSTAFSLQPDLLEYAIDRHVMIASPVSLLALLLAAGHGWRERRLDENRSRIAEAGKTLYERLLKFLGPLETVGSSLGKTVKAYNESVGSLQRRLLPAGEQLKMLTGQSDALPRPEVIEQGVRELDVIEQEEPRPGSDA